MMASASVQRIILKITLENVAKTIGNGSRLVEIRVFLVSCGISASVNLLIHVLLDIQVESFGDTYWGTMVTCNLGLEVLAEAFSCRAVTLLPLTLLQ